MMNVEIDDNEKELKLLMSLAPLCTFMILFELKFNKRK